MKTSPAGRAAIARREGNLLTAYQDSKGIWTIGVGHTSAAGDPKVTKGLKITAAQSDEILSRDLAGVEKTINRAIKVPLNQNEFDALVSFVFNVGGAAFRNSSLLRKLNAGDRQGAADQFLVWNKITKGGKKVVLDGLTRRRKEERVQFLKAVSVPAQKPILVEAKVPEPAAPSDREVVTRVQQQLKDLGYTEVGAVDGKIGTMTATAIRAFRAENGLAEGDQIDDALLLALQKAKPRQIAPERSDAPPEVVRDKVLEVKTNWLTKVGAFFTGIAALIGSFFDGIVGNLGSAAGYIQPVKDAAGDVPGWVWLLAIAIIAGGLYLIARHGEKKGVEAFQTGARR